MGLGRVVWSAGGGGCGCDVRVVVLGCVGFSWVVFSWVGWGGPGQAVVGWITACGKGGEVV